MSKLAEILVVVVVVSADLATFYGPARAADAVGEEPAAVDAHSEDFPSHPWILRAEGTILDTREGTIGPSIAVGLTAGRFVAARLSIEGTLLDGPNSAWSMMANARWAPLRTDNGRHALTLAGGPLVVMSNGVHGTIPLAHAEIAYIFRAWFGLTVLVGLGENLAVTDSSYVAPTSCSLPCAKEIHRGDLLRQGRAAMGWTF